MCVRVSCDKYVKHEHCGAGGPRIKNLEDDPRGRAARLEIFYSPTHECHECRVTKRLNIDNPEPTKRATRHTCGPPPSSGGGGPGAQGTSRSFRGAPCTPAALVHPRAGRWAAPLAHVCALASRLDTSHTRPRRKDYITTRKLPNWHLWRDHHASLSDTVHTTL